MTTIIFFATYLGAKHGGINVFNSELLRVFRELPEFRLVCVVPNDQCIDPSYSEDVETISLGAGSSEPESMVSFAPKAANLIREKVGLVDAVVGHDIVTGELALDTAEALDVSKRMVICHMAYGSYIAMIRDSENAKGKELKQRGVFDRASHVFAVGPLLAEYSADLMRLKRDSSEPYHLYPPFLDVEPVSRPNNHPRMIFAGRIECENDKVKQASFAARALGRALGYGGGSSSQLLKNVTIDFYGFEESEPGAIMADEFQQAIDFEAKRNVPVKTLPFDPSRERMLDAIARSSLLIMPSSHEGFGLVAWEAMCQGIPVVVSENSGFYKFVESIGMADKVVPIESYSSSDKEVTDKHIGSLAQKLQSILLHQDSYHRNAQVLLKAARESGKVEESLQRFLTIAASRPVVFPPARSQSSGEGFDQTPLTISIALTIDDHGRARLCLDCSSSYVILAIESVRQEIRTSRISVSSKRLTEIQGVIVAVEDAERIARMELERHKIQEHVHYLSRFLQMAFDAIASDSFVKPTDFWGDEGRGEAFCWLVNHIGGGRVSGRRLNATSQCDGQSFALWLPEDYVKGHRVLDRQSLALDYVTAADLWWQFSSQLVGCYLLEVYRTGALEGKLISPFGDPDRWRIEPH